MTEYPLVSILTLNYNQAAVTCAFLESAKKLTYPNYEILVCDMASAEDPGLISQGHYPHTTLYRCESNLGFSGGNNWGMEKAKGDFIFIVNNDTELTPGILEQLLRPFAEQDHIGVTCPKILYYDHPDTIQYAGFNAMNLFTGRTSARGSDEKDTGQYNDEGPTYGAHGCAMMVKREVIEQVGRFPEKFFLYYEEWDWSARIRKAGYQIWYNGQASIYHKESVSVGRGNPLKTYYHTRNRIWYIRRNAGAGQQALFALFFTFFSMPKALLKYLIRGDRANLKAFLKGAAWNLYSSSSTPT